MAKTTVPSLAVASVEASTPQNRLVSLNGDTYPLTVLAEAIQAAGTSRTAGKYTETVQSYVAPDPDAAKDESSVSANDKAGLTTPK